MKFKMSLQDKQGKLDRGKVDYSRGVKAAGMVFFNFFVWITDYASISFAQTKPLRPQKAIWSKKLPKGKPMRFYSFSFNNAFFL